MQLLDEPNQNNGPTNKECTVRAGLQARSDRINEIQTHPWTMDLGNPLPIVCEESRFTRINHQEKLSSLKANSNTIEIYKLSAVVIAVDSLKIGKYGCGNS